MPRRKQGNGDPGQEGEAPLPGGEGSEPPSSGGPPAPPLNGHQPPAGGDDGGEARFRAILTDFFQVQVLPNLTRHFDEVMEARVADLRAQVDPVQAAQKAVEILKPVFNANVQAVVNDLTARIAQVERVAEHAAQQAGGTPSTRSEPVTLGQPGATSRELTTDKVSGWVALAQSLVDYGAEKIWPLIQQNQMMKMMGMRDMAWAQELRNTNPFMAQILAGTLAPDPLTAMMTKTIPDVFGQGLLTGARQVRSLAQLLRDDGGAGWPGGTPSSGSSGGLPGAGGTPNGSTPSLNAPPSAASMAQKPRPKPKLKQRSNLSEPEPKASEQAPEPPVSPRVRRLADLA